MTTTPSPLAALSDRYRIERELGQGGMATVYLARDLKYERNVAIKVLRPELAHSLGPDRFLREITITAQFDHPYILPLLDSGVIEPSPANERRLLYYVMPFVEGESLHDRLAREKQLPVEDALQIAREVADALGYAHARNVVHRDIKPGNILLSGGHARVADFGIARAVDAAGTARLTETGLALGTPAYMSPEQSMGERDIDGRSDLYALGCVLYEMLAGEPPCTGPTAQAIIAKRMTNPAPSVRTLRELVPEPVDRALTRALAKSPADRFPTAAQFSEALASGATSAVTAGAARGHGRRWIAGVAALLGVTLLGGWLFARSRRPPIAPSASVIAVLPFEPSSADTALARLGRDLVVTISANLDGVGGIRTSDPRLVLAKSNHSGSAVTAEAIALGRNLGAGSVLVGNIVRIGAGVRLDLKLLSTTGDSQPLARATVTSAIDSIGVLTDSVTWSVLRQLWRRGNPPSPSYASLTTRSVESLRAFLAGEQFTSAGRWPEAVDAYARAIEKDSTFWLAGWRYNSAKAWLLEARPDTSLQRGYWSHLEAFGPRDRLLVELDRDGDALTEADFLARLRGIVDRYPDDWSVWWWYADALNHWGPMVGVTNAEIRAALQRTVDLNPRLVPMWGHLFTTSVGRDSAQATRALAALEGLGAQSLFDRVLRSGQMLAAPLADSFAVEVTASPVPVLRALASISLSWKGYPAAQVDLNRRLIRLAPRDSLTRLVWLGQAHTWAARGAWDSALVAFNNLAAADPAQIPTIYEMAVAGVWLGGLDTASALKWKAAAAKYIRSLPPDSVVSRRALRVAWADGMFATLRRDVQGVEQARLQLRKGTGYYARFQERSLAGLELELRGEKSAAAESLAVLDLGATAGELTGAHDAYARSVAHLAASRLLLEQGDTSRALKLLRWHEADVPASYETALSQLFAARAYYELARVEEAQGRTEEARDHYQQLLMRYDMPPAAHQHLVDEARAALQREGR